MEVIYTKKFFKDLALIPVKQRKELESFVFETLPTAKFLSELNKFEKMQGYVFCYKARFGSYRVGAVYQNNILELKRVMDRKEIYKYFP